MKIKKQIERNIKAHDKIYGKYEQTHNEIFNQIEQERLYKKLEQAIQSIKTNSNHKLALDYGCGSGNLTNHLIVFGFYTVAADISERFLNLVATKYAHTGMLDTLKVNGQDLSNIENNYFDFVSTYSVLHHVPNYLYIIKEMIRVLKHGGIIYLDHEVNDSYWNRNKHYIDFLRLAQPKPSLNVLNYINKNTNPMILKAYKFARKMITPTYTAEGDIHVWPDDHIEWDKIEDLLTTHRCRCEIVLKEDYLQYDIGYRIDIYEKYKDKCNDMRVLIARKK